jgi:hypothetical protein
MSSASIASLDLALLSYFGLDIKESTRVMYCLEQVDTHHTRLLSLDDFESKYCKQCIGLLQYLWDMYYIAKYNKGTTLNKMDLDEIESTIPSYTTFLPFLFW